MTKETTVIPIRHGDINFIPVVETSGKKIKAGKAFVVGLGETTGHRHILTVEDPKDLIVEEDDAGNQFITLLENGTLSHEEHNTITIPKGKYKKFQEEEVDWFAEGITVKVID